MHKTGVLVVYDVSMNLVVDVTKLEINNLSSKDLNYNMLSIFVITPTFITRQVCMLIFFVI